MSVTDVADGLGELGEDEAVCDPDLLAAAFASSAFPSRMNATPRSPGRSAA